MSKWQRSAPATTTMTSVGAAKQCNEGSIHIERKAPKVVYVWKRVVYRVEWCLCIYIYIFGNLYTQSLVILILERSSWQPNIVLHYSLFFGQLFLYFKCKNVISVCIYHDTGMYFMSTTQNFESATAHRRHAFASLYNNTTTKICRGNAKSEWWYWCKTVQGRRREKETRRRAQSKRNDDRRCSRTQCTTRNEHHEHRNRGNAIATHHSWQIVYKASTAAAYLPLSHSLFRHTIYIVYIYGVSVCCWTIKWNATNAPTEERYVYINELFSSFSLHLT